jgi:predicted ATP-grasp superfamily ATP-dependent carboligase
MTGRALALTPLVILVTDGEQRAALACVRSLGRAGHRLIVASSRPRSLAGASRFANAYVQVPDSLSQPEGFLTRISEVARQRSVQVLLPITEQSLLPILAAPERFPGSTIPFARLDQFERISDKGEVMSIARSLNIAVPDQHTLITPADREHPTLSQISFPVVIKPARSVVSVNGERTKVGVSYASDARDLAARLREYPEGAYPLLVQQRIVGPGIGVFLLVWDGETIAVCGHRRIRETPPSGGVSVYREAITPPAALVAQSRELLDRFAWQGVAMIEYKMDSTSGIPYLMEINGRFWGSLQLAIDAGVDFPKLLVESALGMRHPMPLNTAVRNGIRSRWEWGDVNHLIARLRRSPQALSLPNGSPGRRHAVVDFMRWRRGDRLEVLRLDDPGPFVRETLDWFRGR